MDLSKDEIISILRCADAVCLDVDSTVCPDEGIDEFANFYGVGKAVKQLTNQAMGGTMTFQEALKARMKIINPTSSRLEAFLEARTPQVTEGVKNFVDMMRDRMCDVFLVSGGFTEIIAPAAKLINVPITNIYANKFLFYYDGEHAGVDQTCPTCRSGGKANVIQTLKEKFGYRKIVMIGDGATDMEACPPADAFIGFGGNVVRESVKEKSNWFAYSFEEIIESLLE